MGDRNRENRVLSGVSMSAFPARGFMVLPKSNAFLDMRQDREFHFPPSQYLRGPTPTDTAFSFSI
jgi:hypothetical protein